MGEILLVLIVGLCLFDALVSWSSALGVAFMRSHVPFCEEKNREREARRQELWS